MQNSSAISFGDHVRVRETPETVAIGIAGRSGEVLGETTPSVMGIEVIGKLENDFALSVRLEDTADSYWIVPELLELLDHSPGMEIRLAGVAKKWTRSDGGEWIETADKKPWWKFW